MSIVDQDYKISTNVLTVDDMCRARDLRYSYSQHSNSIGWAQQQYRDIDSNWVETKIARMLGDYRPMSMYNTVINTNEKQEGKMKLYQIYAVNPQTEQIVIDEKVIAASKEEVILNSKLSAVLTELKLKLSDVDYFIYEIGSLRAKKEVQEVKIITE